MKSMLPVGLVSLAFMAAPAASGDIRFFDLSDPAGEQAFYAAVEGLDLLTSDAFAGMEPEFGETYDLENALLPGVANGPLFPEGSPVEFGLTIQTNFDGGAPDAPNPAGLLFTYRPAETGNMHFASFSNWNSIDMIVDPPGLSAQAFVFDAFYFGMESDSGTGEVRVYSAENELLGFETFEFVEFPAGRKIGIVASEDSLLHRINFWTGDYSWADVSTFGIYVIPEPATVAILFGAGALAVAGAMRWRRNCAQ